MCQFWVKQKAIYKSMHGPARPENENQSYNGQSVVSSEASSWEDSEYLINIFLALSYQML